jgi:hypothetical protein
VLKQTKLKKGNYPWAQGCQMVYFQAQNPDLGKFWRALEWKRLVYSMAVWDTYITAI